MEVLCVGLAVEGDGLEDLALGLEEGRDNYLVFEAELGDKILPPQDVLALFPALLEEILQHPVVGPPDLA